MYFTGVGGARVHAKLLRPRAKAKKKRPAILMFHGLLGKHRRLLDKLGYAAEGYTVAALDCRGQGGLSEDAGKRQGQHAPGHIIRGLDDEPENLLFRQIYLDTAQLAGIVMDMPDVDAARVGATGGSQGGGLTWPACRSSRASSGRRRCSPSCATTSACGRSISPRTPTTS